MSAHRGANSILRLHCIPLDVALDDFAIAYFVLHRLGIGLAPHLLPAAPLLACYATTTSGILGCKIIPPSRRPLPRLHRPPAAPAP